MKTITKLALFAILFCTSSVFAQYSIDLGNDTLICGPGASTPIVMTANMSSNINPAINTWTSKPFDSSYIVFDSTYPGLHVSPLTTTTYYVSSNYMGEVATDSMTVYVNEIPYVTPDPTICQGECVSLTASGFPFTYTWSNLDTTSILTVCPSTTTTYTVEVRGGFACDPVHVFTVYVVPKPNTQFTYYLDSTNSTPNVYIFSSLNDSSNLTYTWNFGDGSTSNEQNPNHQFINVGTYSVSVSIVAPYGCQDTATQLIYIPNSVPRYTLGGQVFGGSNPIDLGFAYLYSYDGSNIIPIDTAIIDTLGYYHFHQFLANNYIVKAELQDNSIIFGHYAPTYYIYSDLWNNANLITLNQNIWDADIHLLKANHSSGIGNIGGSVVQGNKNTKNLSMNSINILLKGTSNEIIAFTKPDDNGNFNFNNVALGNYQIIADYTGKISVPVSISLDENNPDANNVILEVQETQIAGISNKEEANNSIGNIYPNPAVNQISIPFNLDISADFDFRIYNIAQQEIMSSQAYLPAGQNNHLVNIEKLNAGSYFVKITSKDLSMQRTCKLIIVR